jgi:iron complex outermembrane receptor protein
VVYNEFWMTDTLRALLASRIETVRLDDIVGIFPSILLPPPDNPDLLLQSLGFMPKSISFSVVKDLPSWMVAERLEPVQHQIDRISMVR